MEKFKLSDKQAEAILEMRLSALAALERKRIEDEYDEIIKKIAYLEDLLANPGKILTLIKTDLEEVETKYGDERRTAIIPRALGDFSAEDLIPDEQVIVALSRGNYIKRQEVSTYRKQTRGGVGVIGMTTKEEDIIDHLVSASTHDDIYFFTNEGRVFKSKVYELPASGRQSKGTPIVNIIQIGQGEKVTALLTVSKKTKGIKYFVMGTTNGQIKKTEIAKYENIRKTGIIAMGLKGNDEMKWVKTSSGDGIIVEVSEQGNAICYQETEVRPMGRSASGVTGMRMRQNDRVMAMSIVPAEFSPFGKSQSYKGPDMLVVLENGFGKRTKLVNFNLQKRGGMGIKAANCTNKTGDLIGMHIAYSSEGDVILASQKGQFIRMKLDSIKRLGRDTQGVTLMKMKSQDKVSSVAVILPEESIPEGVSNIDQNKDPEPKNNDKTAEKIKIDKPVREKNDNKVIARDAPAKKIIQKDKNIEPTKSTNMEKFNVNFYSPEKEKTAKEDKDDARKDYKISSYKDINKKTADDRNDSAPKMDETNYWGKDKNL